MTLLVQRTALRATAVVGLSLSAWALWLGYVLWGSGWAGLAWLSIHGSWAPAASTALVVLALGIGPLHQAQASWKRWLLWLGLEGGLAFVAYGVAGGLFRGLFGRQLFFLYGLAPEVTELWAALGAVALAFSMGTWVLLRLLGVRLPAWFAVLLLLLLLAVPTASELFISVFPPLGGSADFVSAVKMGYPALLTGLLLGGLGVVTPVRS